MGKEWGDVVDVGWVEVRVEMGGGRMWSKVVRKGGRLWYFKVEGRHVE